MSDNLNDNRRRVVLSGRRHGKQSEKRKTLDALTESIKVNSSLPPSTIVMVSSELGRALAHHFLNGGDPAVLPPGWDTEKVIQHVTVIRNVGIEQGDSDADL